MWCDCPAGAFNYQVPSTVSYLGRWGVGVVVGFCGEPCLEHIHQALKFVLAAGCGIGFRLCGSLGALGGWHSY